MTDFGEAVEATVSLIVGGIVMFVFGSAVTETLFNVSFIGIVFTVVGIVGAFGLVAIAIHTALS